MTESTHKMEGNPEFDDEEEEIDNRNNIVTQTELFKNYQEQNILFVNQTQQLFWYEFGGKKIGKMLIDITQ